MTRVTGQMTVLPLVEAIAGAKRSDRALKSRYLNMDESVQISAESEPVTGLGLVDFPVAERGRCARAISAPKKSGPESSPDPGGPAPQQPIEASLHCISLRAAPPMSVTLTWRRDIHRLR
jgi:hypothetical protein